MVATCVRCGEGELNHRTGVCSVCDEDTRFWLAKDYQPVLNSIRWSIFRRISSLPRHALVLPSFDLDLAGFELLFSSHGAVSTSENLESDSDEEEPVCVKKRVIIKGLKQVQAFASFHELQHSKGPVQGACQAAKVWPSSGEVSVLIPPLEAHWWLSATKCEKVEVIFSYAVVSVSCAVSLATVYLYILSAFTPLTTMPAGIAAGCAMQALN